MFLSAIFLAGVIVGAIIAMAVSAGAVSDVKNETVVFAPQDSMQRSSDEMFQTLEYVSPPKPVETVPEEIEPEYEWLTFQATAYCACEKCCGSYGKNRPVDDDGNVIVTTASGNSLTAEEFMKLIAILGYEVKIVEMDTSEEIRNRRKGVGKRLQMMVNGVRYDTYKADAICHSDETDDIFYELYQDMEGRYFVAQYVKWEGGISSISPIGKEDALKLMKKFE